MTTNKSDETEKPAWVVGSYDPVKDREQLNRELAEIAAPHYARIKAIRESRSRWRWLNYSLIELIVVGGLFLWLVGFWIWSDPKVAFFIIPFSVVVFIGWRMIYNWLGIFQYKHKKKR